MSLINQFSRFFVVGIINTGVDLAVLNILIWLFGADKSISYYPLFKTISFLAAVINSYIFNKYWVFATTTKKQSVQRESLLFFLVSTFGFLLNVVVATSIFHLITTLYTQNIFVASDVGAIVGTLVVLISNFIGYKFLVFKDKKIISM